MSADSALTAVFAAADERRDVMEPLRRAGAMSGWLTFHPHRSERSEAGFPDVVFVRVDPFLEPSGAVRRPLVVFVECKRERAKLTLQQAAWAAALAGIEGATRGLVAYRVARPSNRHAVEALLTGEAPDGSERWAW